MMLISNFLVYLLVVTAPFASGVGQLDNSVPCYFKLNFGNYYIGLNENDAYLPYALPNNKEDRFRLVSPGLTGVSGTVSFESEKHPGHYLRHQWFKLHLSKYMRTNVYAKDATFIINQNPIFAGYDMYRSVNYPTYFILADNQFSNRLVIAEYPNPPWFNGRANFKSTCEAFHTRSTPRVFKGIDVAASKQWGMGINGYPHMIIPKPHNAFKIVRPGLSGSRRSISFESETFPGYYLRHSGFHMYLHPYKEQPTYRKDASFFQIPGKDSGVGHISYRSENYPTYVIQYHALSDRLIIKNHNGLISVADMKAATFTESSPIPLQLEQCTFQSYNYLTRAAGIDPNSGDPKLIPLALDPQLIIVEPGLNGILGTYSIASRRHPAHYLRARLTQNTRIFLAEYNHLESTWEKNQATFYKYYSEFYTGCTTFKSYSYSNYYFRHQNFFLEADSYPAFPSNLEKQDASFILF